MNWTFLLTPPRPAAAQMAIDHGLLESLATGASGPVFRLYTWRPPAVSLGVHQDPDREVDRAALSARGVDLVVRPTGGRAIYHDEELTYAVVCATDDPVFGGSITASHAAISRVFQAALSRLGVAAAMGPPGATPDEPAGAACAPDPGGAPATGSSLACPPGSARRDRSVPSPCFDSATRTELTVNGRKILGSAQRRTGAAFLQHGSLLLGDAHLQLVDFLPVSAEVRERLRRDLERKTTTVARETGRWVPVEEVVAATTAALGETLGRSSLRFEEGPQ